MRQEGVLASKSRDCNATLNYSITVVRYACPPLTISLDRAFPTASLRFPEHKAQALRKRVYT